MKKFGLRFTYNKKSAYLLSGFVLLIFITLISLFLISKKRPDVSRESRAPDLSYAALERQVTTVSPLYEIDRIYKSMKGPSSQHMLILDPELLSSKKPELIWITGYKAVMVGADGETPVSQEFMCHSNLDIDIRKHAELFGWEKNNPSTRLFTLSQGQFDIAFPEGFGVPVLATEPLYLVTQVLNLNDKENKYKVRHKITIDYIRDSDLTIPMKPLMMIGAIGLKLLEGQDGYFGMASANEDEHGPGCSLGQNADFRTVEDKFNRKFTLHWVVKPGREVNRTLATKYMNLPYDTAIHYIAVHLHPFAESVELRDLTTGKTVYKSKTRLAKHKIGIEEVEYFSSDKGIPLYKDHEYQVISVYNNTTDQDQDAMVTIFLYVLDKEFQKPATKL
ncbi:MAG: hypothetical protein WBD99_14605 [Thermodesulfobacteriota bacterium]